MSQNTTLIQTLEIGIYVTKHNSYLATINGYISPSTTLFSDTRNREIYHQTQLLFSHYKQGYISPSATLIQTLETGIYVAKHNSDSDIITRDSCLQTQL
jgi:hypothetical protein